MYMRRASRRDENEKEIVEALRAVGATVYLLNEPCDLLVGYHNQTILMELKNPNSLVMGKKGLTLIKSILLKTGKVGHFAWLIL